MSDTKLPPPPEQGITAEQARELATEAERPIVEILLRGGAIKTNRFCLQAAREIVRADSVVSPDLISAALAIEDVQAIRRTALLIATNADARKMFDEELRKGGK